MPQPERASVVAEPRLGPQSEKLVRIAASCIILATIIGTLYLARPVLLPFALATLFAFALAPIVSVLQRWRIPRPPAVMLTVAFAALIVAVLAVFIGAQLSALAPDMPRYQGTLLAKIESIRNSAARSSLIKGATGIFQRFDRAIDNDGAASAPQPSGGVASTRPMPVVIRSPDPGPLQVVENIADPLLVPLADAALVVIFAIFILVQKEDLRDRFIWLAGGARNLQRMTAAIDEGAAKLSRYLLLQTSVNIAFGALIATALWLMGIPSAGLWGLIAGIARFIPYVGLPIASVLPLTLALAVDPGWTRLLLVACIMFGTEAVTGQAIEPLLYGRQMGLSPIAIMLCAVFWTWIWGPVGLLLSTPLTMCMVIIGRNVGHLKFLDILLGDRGPLRAEEAFYLRTLTGRIEEEAAHAEVVLKDASLCAYFDEIALKGLALARVDEERGALDPEGGRNIHMAVRALLDDIADADTVAAASSEHMPDRPCLSPGVLIVATRGDLDWAAAALLGTVLLRHGIGVQTVSAEMTSGLPQDCADVKVICISCLGVTSAQVVRYCARRIRRQIPQARTIAGLWSEDHNDTSYLDAIQTTQCDGIAFTIGDAVTQISTLLKSDDRVESAAEGATQPASAQHPSPARGRLIAP